MAPPLPSKRSSRATFTPAKPDVQQKILQALTEVDRLNSERHSQVMARMDAMEQRADERHAELLAELRGRPAANGHAHAPVDPLAATLAVEPVR